MTASEQNDLVHTAQTRALRSQLLDLQSNVLAFLQQVEAQTLAMLGPHVPDTRYFQTYFALCESVGHEPALTLTHDNSAE